MSQLTADRYVDSYTMNNLFKVSSWNQIFTNPKENKNYFLASSPTMSVSDDKIYIDLIDATFEADINVIDNDTFNFSNIIKKDKENVTYPTRNCTNEPGPNECIDGDESLQYEDQLFTAVISDFLEGNVTASNSGTPDNGILWLHNDTLSFDAFYN